MALRSATPDDAPAMAALAQTAGVVGWSARALGDSLHSPLMRAGVWDDVGGLGGFWLGRMVADEAELLLIAVVSERRRSGLGRTLFTDFERVCDDLGVTEIHLEVAEGNAPARALYDGLGFEAVGRREAYYADGTAALLMTKPVGPTSVV